MLCSFLGSPFRLVLIYTTTTMSLQDPASVAPSSRANLGTLSSLAPFQSPARQGNRAFSAPFSRPKSSLDLAAARKSAQFSWDLLAKEPNQIYAAFRGRELLLGSYVVGRGVDFVQIGSNSNYFGPSQLPKGQKSKLLRP